MTLVAGFRSRNGGVLLCSDREEGDGYSKREVDKITTISLQQCKVFIAGAGPTAIITKAYTQFAEALQTAEGKGVDLETDHRLLLEESLEGVYDRYVLNSDYEVGLLIVVAFHAHKAPHPPPPLMYRTEGRMLLPAGNYVACGTGRVIADYLADRLYREGIERINLWVLAAFIFREASNASPGVGLGTDMILIFDGDRLMRFAGQDVVKELQLGIPVLADSIYAHWGQGVTVPDSLLDKPTR